MTVAFTLGALSPGSPTPRCSCCWRWSPATPSCSGLVYALVWESLVGGLVPGAQALSVQQWSLAVVQQVLGDSAQLLGVDAAVGFGTAAVLLAVVTLAATAYAGRRLQRLRLTEA